MHWFLKLVLCMVLSSQSLMPFSLGNTIWLDPLVARTHLKEINVTTNTFNVRMDLLKEGLAVPNPEVL